MKNLFLISTTLDQSDLLKNLVEQLAQRRYDIGYCRITVPKKWKAIENSSTDTFVSGTVAIVNNEERFKIPYITRFLFTCIKEKNNPYTLEWSSSLS